MLEPHSLLKHFMAEMHSWEKRCAARDADCISGKMDFDDATRIGVAEYQSIFERFCSQTRASPREFHFTEPPDYDAKGEVIVSVRPTSPGVVEVHTRQTYSHKKCHVFRLVLEDGQWRLLDRRILVGVNQILDACL